MTNSAGDQRHHPPTSTTVACRPQSAAMHGEYSGDT
jgi:hypothetical protein